MITDLHRYKTDLEKLINDGEILFFALIKEFSNNEIFNFLSKKDEGKYFKMKNKLPSFRHAYQPWYSESLILLKQLLPDRVSDFKKYYESPKKGRNVINEDNCVIEDLLINRQVFFGGYLPVIHQFIQQLKIIEAIKSRFESSLFEIKKLVQADLFDSELEAAKELNKKGFFRGAGAIAGVVLEKHLSQVCESNSVVIIKKDPSITNYNERLKEEGIFDIQIWRKIQHLGDLRNLCDHNKNREPKMEEVEELIEGVAGITKSIFK